MTCNNIPVLNLCDIKKGATFSQILTFTTENVSTGAETNRDFTDYEKTKLLGIEEGATSDQTAAANIQTKKL